MKAIRRRSEGNVPSVNFKITTFSHEELKQENLFYQGKANTSILDENKKKSSHSINLSKSLNENDSDQIKSRSERSLSKNIELEDAIKEQPERLESMDHVEDDPDEIKIETDANGVCKIRREAVEHSYYKSEYFKQDTSDELYLSEKQKRNITFESIKDHHVFFRTSQFIEFFIYHILFFLILGPFFPLLFYNYCGKVLLINMGFWYGCSIAFITQIGTWILVSLSNWFYFYNVFQGKPSAYLIEILSVWIMLLLRCLAVAIKYGTFHPHKIYLWRTQLITREQKAEETMMADWRTQTQQIISNEYNNAIMRAEIDISLTYFNFIVPPKPETDEKLKSLEKSFKEIHKKDWIAFSPLRETILKTKIKSQFYYGMCIFEQLVQSAPKTPWKKILMVLMSSSFIRNMIPFLCRFLYHSDNSPLGGSKMEAVQLIFIFLANSYHYFLDIAFILVFCAVLQTKLHFMIQLSFLLSVKNEREYHSRKIFPTLNFLCYYNIRAWSILRKISLDYGKKFYMRCELLFQVVCLIILVEGILLIIKLVGGINMDIATSLVCLCDIVLLVMVLSYLLYKGACINDHFRIHRNILMEVKSLVEDLKNFSFIYLKDDFVHTNIVMKKGSEYLKEQISAARITNLNESLEEVIQVIDEIIDDLNFEAQNNPFRVLGFPVSKPILRKIAMLLVPFLSLLVQYSLRTNF